jgi:hypothetical protein
MCLACKAVYTGSIPVGAFRTSKPNSALQCRLRPSPGSRLAPVVAGSFGARLAHNWRTGFAAPASANRRSRGAANPRRRRSLPLSQPSPSRLRSPRPGSDGSAACRDLERLVRGPCRGRGRAFVDLTHQALSEGSALLVGRTWASHQAYERRRHGATLSPSDHHGQTTDPCFVAATPRWPRPLRGRNDPWPTPTARRLRGLR